MYVCAREGSECLQHLQPDDGAVPVSIASSILTGSLTGLRGAAFGFNRLAARRHTREMSTHNHTNSKNDGPISRNISLTFCAVFAEVSKNNKPFSFA